MQSPTERSPPGTNRQPAVVSAVSPQQDPSGPVLAWWLSGTPGFLSEPARGGGGRGEAYPLTHYKPPHLLPSHAGRVRRAMESCQLKIQIQLRLRSNPSLATTLPSLSSSLEC